MTDNRFAFFRGGPKVTRRSLIKGGTARAITAGVRTEAAAAPALTEEELEAHSIGRQAYHSGRYGLHDIEDYAEGWEHMHHRIKEGFESAWKKHGPHPDWPLGKPPDDDD